MTMDELIQRSVFAMHNNKPHIFKYGGRWVAFCHHQHSTPKKAQQAFNWVEQANRKELAK